VLHKNAHVKIQSDEAINIYQCENATISKMQNVKMKEITALEDSKIELSNSMENGRIKYDDEVRNIEDTMADCKMKMDYEKQKQSTMRNQLGENSRMINE